MKSDFVVGQISRDLVDFGYSEALENLARRRVLVTGASGMIGTYFATALILLQRELGKTPQVVPVTRQNSAYYEALGIPTIRPPEAVNILASGEVDAAIHAASPAHASAFMSDPLSCFEVNVNWTKDLAIAAIASNSDFIYISSGEVYGPNPPVPTCEDSFGPVDTFNPRSIYAVSKRAGEALLGVLFREEGLSLRVCRLFHTFGPGMRRGEPRIFGTIVEAALLDMDCVLHCNDSSTRSFLYSLDSLEGVAHALAFLPAGQPVNVAGTKASPIRDLASVSMSSLTNGKRTTITSNIPVEKNINHINADRLEANVSLLLSTGWSPKVTLIEGFSRTLASLKGV